MKSKPIILFMTMCMLLLAGCSQAQTETADKTVQPEKVIRIGVMPDVESIPLIIAEKNGYFASEGVNVELIHFKSARDRDSALQTGELDGVITDLVAVVFANEGGIDLKAVSRIDGNVELLAGSNSGIQTMQDLKGKNIGLSSNTIMEYSLDRMLENAGLPAGDVSKTAIPALPTRLEMLQGGQIDAAIMPQPLSDLAKKNGAVVLNSTDDMNNKAGVMAFTSQIIQNDPQSIKAVYRAYDQGVSYLQTAPVDDYIDFVIESQGFPAEVKGAFKLPRYQAATAPDEKILNDVVAWMQSKQLIKGSYTYKDIVDDQIMR